MLAHRSAAQAALEVADGLGRTPLAVAAASGCTANVALLLGASAQLGAPGRGRSALVEAAQAGHADALALLLRAGADVTAPGEGGLCPLAACLDAPRLHARCIELLLGAGANPVPPDCGIARLLARLRHYNNKELSAPAEQTLCALLRAGAPLPPWGALVRSSLYESRKLEFVRLETGLVCIMYGAARERDAVGLMAPLSRVATGWPLRLPKWLRRAFVDDLAAATRRAGFRPDTWSPCDRDVYRALMVHATPTAGAVG